jgi:Flp pilus assembly protein TadD
MGRTKTKKTAVIKAKENKASASKQVPSVAALLERAQVLIVQCDYELAHRFITRALEQDEYNPEAREMLGFVEIERGELDNAKAVSHLNFI